ncbi:helix-hairpin-helix domain-containing protein [Marinifilum caeruleilacunae]|uniref:Helix-hairpin-helix domain-containing protein n=1 Tax=Marinifilum caeruleilacunae TaxID=2499076 RepID=A0ABX1WYN9_9BACT|nr:helix-hairpin-helix domain-containing protein [Marinifilum caeruleilacunae]NOU61214.1 helix-hairpin-helix domain-containing protein [Marinifilum caeruleilacunae]
MSIKKYIKEYFSYSTSEKRGLLVLLIILVIVFVVPSIFSRKSEKLIVADENKKVDSIIALLHQKNESKKIELFAFNPNDIEKEGLIRLGLKEYQVNNIVKYRESGGVFKAKSDFRKIYGISDEDYNRLKDYIVIRGSDGRMVKRKTSHSNENLKLFKFNPNTISSSDWQNLGVKPVISNRIRKYLSTGARFKSADDLSKIYGFDPVLLEKLRPYVQIHPSKEKMITHQMIDLNMADTTLLRSLPGIGKVLSSRIVKYKNLLGGYYNKAQLTEVYGISEETYGRISQSVCVSTNEVQKIFINRCTAKVLAKHPYLSMRMSTDIIKYRERVGKYNSIEELRTKHLLSDSVYRKVEPYLSIDE